MVLASEPLGTTTRSFLGGASFFGASTTGSFVSTTGPVEMLLCTSFTPVNPLTRASAVSASEKLAACPPRLTTPSFTVTSTSRNALEVDMVLLILAAMVSSVMAAGLATTTGGVAAAAGRFIYQYPPPA